MIGGVLVPATVPNGPVSNYRAASWGKKHTRGYIINVMLYDLSNGLAAQKGLDRLGCLSSGGRPSLKI
jgi:hypothetical protein